MGVAAESKTAARYSRSTGGPSEGRGAEGYRSIREARHRRSHGTPWVEIGAQENHRSVGGPRRQTMVGGRSMGAAWLGVIGTLLGAVVGTAGALLSQRLSEDRAARRAHDGMKRSCYVEFLGGCSELYEATWACYVDAGFPRGLDSEDLRRSLRDLPTRRTRESLDELRLLAPARVVKAAQELMWLLRDGRVVGAQTNLPDPIRLWRRTYWERRHDLLEAFRTDLGVGGGIFDEWSTQRAKDPQPGDPLPDTT